MRERALKYYPKRMVQNQEHQMGVSMQINRDRLLRRENVKPSRRVSSQHNLVPHQWANLTERSARRNQTLLILRKFSRKRAMPYQVKSRRIPKWRKKEVLRYLTGCKRPRRFNTDQRQMLIQLMQTRLFKIQLKERRRREARASNDQWTKQRRDVNMFNKSIH